MCARVSVGLSYFQSSKFAPGEHRAGSPGRVAMPTLRLCREEAGVTGGPVAGGPGAPCFSKEGPRLPHVPGPSFSFEGSQAWS